MSNAANEIIKPLYNDFSSSNVMSRSVTNDLIFMFDLGRSKNSIQERNAKREHDYRFWRFVQQYSHKETIRVISVTSLRKFPYGS